MAASFLQKLLKKPLPSPPLRILTSLYRTQLPIPPTSPVLHQNPGPSPNPNPNSSLTFYPSFPHCFSLDPISVNGLLRSDGQMGSGDDDGPAVWADSVKKKRKKKMNKHKLKKLRKRLRRKA